VPLPSHLLVLHLAKRLTSGRTTFQGADHDFLFRPHPLLEGRRPLDVVLASEFGRPIVEGILGRLKFGSAAWLHSGSTASWWPTGLAIRTALTSSDATGSKLFPVRWNTPASPMVYTSEHYSGAMLEKLMDGSGRMPPN
jgi:hypothetical protein